MRRVRRRYRGALRLVLVLVLVVAPASGAGTQAPAREPLPATLAWVGLYTDSLVHWLENGNRLDELCPGERDTEPWLACRNRQMEPRVAVLPVRDGPARQARRLGELVIVATPGRGLSAHASGAAGATPFAPDLFDVDWGYGPWFHQTILARRGSTWFRVPIPTLGAGWIDTGEWSGGATGALPAEAPHVEVADSGRIVTTPRGDLVILGAANGVLRARPEQDADMWCDTDPPPLKRWTELRIPFAELFDANGHLLLQVKYTRGC